MHLVTVPYRLQENKSECVDPVSGASNVATNISRPNRNGEILSGNDGERVR
jgi:hypothetical protein